MEDKKCRICGFADMANVNIYFTNAKLVEKIVAVYPIVLYPNDPLPKHICKKCLLSTTSMYTEIERAVRNQKKWIANVRAVQPDNQFVKVVDSIESANKATAKSVSKLYGEELGERTVCRLLNFKSDDHHTPVKPMNNVRRETVMPLSAPMDVDPSPPTISTVEKETNVPKPRGIGKTTKITQLKSVLELNGCTLIKVEKPARTASETGTTPGQVEIAKVKVKEESRSSENYSEYAVACKMCPFRSETVEELAIHQLEHLNLSIPKLLERRYLDKKVRRGRLITIGEKKCIRCVNCWRIFVDNKSILNHWYVGDCEFFCQICGKEFLLSPKMLREHLLAAHGVSYRTMRNLRPLTRMQKNSIKIKNPTEKSDSSTKANSSNNTLTIKVACTICHKVFANFKARNSHMRAHKVLPPPQPSLSDSLLVLNRERQLLPVKDEPPDYDNIPYHIVSAADAPDIPATSTSSTAHSSTPSKLVLQADVPPPLVISKHAKTAIQTSSPGGIRKKYVQIRSDPKAIVFKTEPGVNSQAIKIKSLVDLQDPSVTSQHTDTLNLQNINSSGTTNPPSNGLDMQSPKDNMNYGQIFNCHPCGGKFSSKLELFRHKRKCTANNLFPCQFCPRQFLTSADLQIHIMLLHKTTGAQ